ncbi:alkaline phosphatase family protein [Marinobacterium rhizophilum]|uniref:Alkaline phosphatase family protein n=1 Tax=Marinobacterium rhizophilum TaxID=420402 RepID=A0ABY5HP53_9GAMM|nr:alkaline phosphatase family protein [Marinobacterium rhizophilum]UTW13661.1 alkaline phosphatase family protein [Marinobacterium rhizophilum]
MSGLIMIMVDGISADHFSRKRHLLPNLDRMARLGVQVDGVTPEVCGTSCPGRTSIIAGVSPAEHGVYGNHILDGDRFRWANPYDVQVETLPALAKQQGLDVACLGYGMVRPEDCTLYQGPWWVDELLMRGKDQEPTPADQDWLRASGLHDPDGRISALFESAAAEPAVQPNHTPEHKLQMGMLADHQLLDLAAALAASDRAPDLMLLEIAITDYFLHKYGPDHPLTDWSLRCADAQIGTLMTRLEQAGVLERYNFAILSDHGHAPMPDALYVDRLLGDEVLWSSEGGVLLVRPTSPEQARYVTEKLSAEGIQPWSNDHLPAERREQLLTFVVPEGSAMSFEASRADTRGIYGPSKYQSNHGMRPGSRADERFCIFYGNRVPQQLIAHGKTIQVAPTLAAILNVVTPWQAPPLFQPKECD